MLAVGLSAALLSTTAAMAAWAGDYLTAQLVVGDPAALTVGDTALKNVMEGEGYTVQLVDDNAAVTATPATTDLVVIGPSTSGTTLGSKYGQLAVPEVILASTAWDSMGLTEDDGVFYDSTSLNWVDTATPIAAWLPNPVQVVPTNQSMRSMVVANLADGATPVAVRSNNTAQNVIFTFSPGDTLTTGTAPAARVVAGLSDPALANLTANGTQLIVNLVTWAAEGSSPLVGWVTAAAPTYCPSTGAVACYEMNDSNSTMLDSTTPPSSLPSATGPSSAGGVNKVKRNAQFAEYFYAGWSGHTTSAGALDATKATIADTFGQTIIDKGIITPTESFNPGTGTWKIKTRIKPYLVVIPSEGSKKNLPLPGPASSGLDKPSYNLIQKGRDAATPPPGGYYKVEIMGRDANNFRRGSAHCIFQDDDGTVAETFSGFDAFNPQLVNKNKYFTIECSRSGNTVTLKVTADGGGTDTSTGSGSGGSVAGLGTVAPPNTGAGAPYGPKFSVGKKPSSTNISDSFAGWVDYVILSS